VTKSRGIGRGGKRPGAGAPISFIPTPEQRAVVKLLTGSGRPQDEIVTAIKNMKTNKPISVDTLRRAFADEIRIGRVEMHTMVLTSLAGQIRNGNMTSIIWYMKNQMGWTDSHEISGKNGGPIPITITINQSRY
jgi:hypothetical protein